MSTLTTRIPRRLVEHAKPGVRWSLQHAIPRGALVRVASQGDPQGVLSTETTGLLAEELAPILARIRSGGAIVGGKLSTLTGEHDAVNEVLTSNDFRTGFPGDTSRAVRGALTWAASTTIGPLEPPSLLATDGPTHTRNRKLVTRVFTARAVEALRERTEQVATELLDDLEADARAGHDVDLVARYCEQLPVTVIAEILGVPESEYQTVLRVGGHAASSLDLGLDWATFRRTESALDEFDAWLETHLAAKRAQPGDDLFSALIQAQDHGVGLSDQELKSVAGLVLAAGFETTVNLLGNAIRLIVGHPEQLAALRSGEASWLNAVEETLRFDPPVLLTARTATCDTRVADVDVAAGTLVVTVLAAANRDPKIFDDPDAFDVHRENAREHLAFSAGRHFCLGAALSRMESEVALRAFFDRFDVELLPGATRRPTRILRGYATLPARLAARA